MQNLRLRTRLLCALVGAAALAGLLAAAAGFYQGQLNAAAWAMGGMFLLGLVVDEVRELRLETRQLQSWLRGSRVLARWQAAAGEWDMWLAVEWQRVLPAVRRRQLQAFAGGALYTALLGCAVLCLLPPVREWPWQHPLFFAGLLPLSGAVGGALAYLYGWLARRAYVPGQSGELWLAVDGMMLNGYLHRWPLRDLHDIHNVEAAEGVPAELRIIYGARGRRYLRAPVAPSHSSDARRLISTLRASRQVVAQPLTPEPALTPGSGPVLSAHQEAERARVSFLEGLEAAGQLPDEIIAATVAEDPYVLEVWVSEAWLARRDDVLARKARALRRLWTLCRSWHENSEPGRHAGACLVRIFDANHREVQRDGVR